MKTVALVDTDNSGHHTAFMRLFAQSLLKLGYRVRIFIPQKELIDKWMDTHCKEYLHNYQSFELKNSYTSYKYLGPFNQAFSVLSRWKNVRRYIKQSEKESKIKIDIVFFAWLDSFLANYLHPNLLHFYFPYKWAGLYFHPRHTRLEPACLDKKASFTDVDIVLTSRKCLGVAIHDEGVVKRYEQRLNNKVVLFPEIADDTAPDTEYWLAKEIKAKAKGRIILGEIGLQRHKGMLTLIRLAKIADPDKYFFAFLGSKTYATLSKEEVDEAEDFFNNPKEHIYTYFESIPEGASYNAVFNLFSVILLVYNAFPSTSNRLTKAAIFRKPVIASNRFCIAEDVEKYQLGKTVEEGNHLEALEKIEILLQEINNKTFTFARHEEYSKIHSTSVLLEKFKEILKPN